jgi:chlorobactene glucosyltransferase
MLALSCGVIWAGLVLYLLCRALRQFRAHRGASLIRQAEWSGFPTVSIIVPARNESRNIGTCLEGLSAQTCLSGRSSIIVVDDDSHDGTTAVVKYHAAADSRISLIAAGALPQGWVGKPHACWRGALLAEGKWLCFVDADVRPGPELVAAAVATAESQGIDMLSLHPMQELGSFWERLVVPAGLLLIACVKPFQTASEDVANGQFLLIRRDAYFQVGGHAAVHAEICEDRALASRIKDAGFRFRVLAAEQFARTRMYRDFGSLWEGFSKNATDVLGSRGATLAAAFAAFAVGWTALLLPLAVNVAMAGEPPGAAMAGSLLTLFGSAVVIGFQCGTARHFRIPAVFGIIFALGYTVALCLVCHSVLAQLRGRVTWKGRTYQLNRTSAERT